jgi:hypothetical protein
MIRRAILICLVALLCPRPALAGCWAPDFTERTDTAVARSAPVAAWQKDLATAAAMLKRIPVFGTIADRRQRVVTYLGHSPGPSLGNFASIRATLHPPNTWIGECEVGKGPEFFNSGNLHVKFNEPRTIFGERPHAVKDDQLTAWFEPKVVEKVGDETLYAHEVVVLTRDGLAPWVDVSVADYLRFKGREIDARVKSAGERLASTRETTLDEAGMQSTLAAMANTDPKAAAEMRKTFDAMRKDMEAQRATAIPEAERQLAIERQARADLDRFVAGLPPAARAAAANLGDGPHGLAGPGRAHRGKLVTINPALLDPAYQRHRVHLIVVHPFANAKEYADELLQAAREVDYAVLRGLLR